MENSKMHLTKFDNSYFRTSRWLSVARPHHTIMSYHPCTMTRKHSSNRSVKCQFPKSSCRRRAPSSGHEIIFRTQNLQPIRLSDHEFNPNSGAEVNFNQRFLSFKYDGILLRHDLDPRILRTREMLKKFPRFIPDSTVVKDQKKAADFKTKLMFVFDTFERLETARRTEATRLLEEKHRFKVVKQRFLQTRAHLLDQVAATIHDATSCYTKDFEDLEKHRHFLEKEISNIRPKIEKSERINKDLMAKISFVQNYGPMIAEKLATEEEQLNQMRAQKSSLDARIKELENAVEDVLVKQDAARLEIQNRKRSLIARLEDKLALLAMHREEREDRKRNPIVHHSCRDFLQNQYDQLSGKMGQFRKIVSDLNDLVAENKIATDATLAGIKAEHAHQEALQREAELTGKPILTKEQIKEKLRQQKARRERKEREKREKELRKKQVLERNFARMRTQMKEASDHLKELHQERLILDPQLERIGLLEETFQSEYDEKANLKAELTAELEQKEEQVQEDKLKLAELESDFKLKIATHRIEMEKARKLRRQQEKLLKDCKKRDRHERKLIQQQFDELNKELEAATLSCQNRLAEYKRAVHHNQEVKTELAEIHLAIKVGSELLPGDEARRKAKAEELNQRAEEAKTTFRIRFEKLLDKNDLCAGFAHWKAQMREQFTRDLIDLHNTVLIELPAWKMKFHVEFSAYQMLVGHKGRCDALKEYVIDYGHQQRILEQARVKNMYDYARTKRRDLADAITENFRAIRKHYHLNVVCHVLHIESVRDYIRNHAVEDGYRSAMELLSTEKIIKTQIQRELEERGLFWSSQLRNYACNLNQHMDILTSVHEEVMQRSDGTWRTLKRDVVDRQEIKMTAELEERFREKLSNSWTWSVPEVGKGDAAYHRTEEDDSFITDTPLHRVSEPFH